MTPKIRLALLAAALSTLPAAAYAQTSPDSGSEPISGERPGFTAGTDTVPPHRFQLETGYLFIHEEKSDFHHFDDSGLLRFSTGANTEVRLIPPIYYLKGTGEDVSSGFGDLGVSYKWRFLDEVLGHRPALALIATTSIPSGAHEVWANRLQPTVDLEAQYTLSPLFQLQANLNYTRGDDGGDQFDQYSGAINLGYNLTKTLSPYIEFDRQTPTGADGAPSATYFDGGIAYVIGRDTQLDLNTGLDLASPSHNNHFFGVGFARRW